MLQGVSGLWGRRAGWDRPAARCCTTALLFLERPVLNCLEILGLDGVADHAGGASWGFADVDGAPGGCAQALARLLMRFPWRFGKIQLVADCVEEGMLAYNGRDWRSFV